MPLVDLSFLERTTAMPDFSIPYFDLHCDTAYEMYVQKKGLKNRSLAISQHQADVFPHYAQCFAVWSDCRLSAEDAYCQFLRIAEYFSSMLQRAEHAKRLLLSLQENLHNYESKFGTINISQGGFKPIGQA
mgnify:CR=1 FL=1